MTLVPIRTLFLFFIIISSILLLHESRQLSDSKMRLLTPPPPYIEYLTFGFADVMADSLWLRLLQDLGECDLFVKIEPWRQKSCDQGWSFSMLNAITLLAPRFRMPYAVGALSLSIINSDVSGAGIIFDRALQNYPNDWPILYRAAYYYQFDAKNKRRAAELLNRAAENGAPEWVRSLASRLYTQEGELELALTSLMSYRKTIMDNDSRAADIDRRIRELQAKLDKLQAKSQ